MAKTKTLQTTPDPALVRYQTAVPGMTYVSTVVDGHFDPYAQPKPRAGLSRAQMETVKKVTIPA